MEFDLNKETDRRNVSDKFKGMSNDKIKESLNKTRHNFSLLISNKSKCLAAGTLVRSCNAFGVKNIIFYGRRDFNRVSSVGTYLYENILVAHDINELSNIIKQEEVHRVIGLENNIDKPTKFLHEYSWDKNIHYLVCVGNETGLDPEIMEICQEFIELKSYGSVRSIFLAAAGSILLYDYCAKMERA